jgi:hypothetical protein
MTCTPDAFNTGEVDVLQPDEELRLEWGFELRTAQAPTALKPPST